MKKGFLPAIVQDIDTNRVLMVAYVNKESLQMTLDTKKSDVFPAAGRNCGSRASTRAILCTYRKSMSTATRIRLFLK